MDRLKIEKFLFFLRAQASNLNEAPTQYWYIWQRALNWVIFALNNDFLSRNWWFSAFLVASYTRTNLYKFSLSSENRKDGFENWIWKEIWALSFLRLKSALLHGDKLSTSGLLLPQARWLFSLSSVNCRLILTIACHNVSLNAISDIPDSFSVLQGFVSWSIFTRLSNLK
jgi:hypothetical protein